MRHLAANHFPLFRDEWQVVDVGRGVVGNDLHNISFSFYHHHCSDVSRLFTKSSDISHDRAKYPIHAPEHEEMSLTNQKYEDIVVVGDREYLTAKKIAADLHITKS